MYILHVSLVMSCSHLYKRDGNYSHSYLFLQSSLLMAVLGELPRLGGFLRTSGKIGYVPQNPWLFKGSIRDNILFGRNLNNQQYNKVLHACGLLPVS